MMFRSYEVECVYVSSICVRVGVECVVLCVSALVCGLDHSCVVLGYVSFICFVWGCCSYICAGGVSLSLVCVVIGDSDMSGKSVVCEGLWCGVFVFCGLWVMWCPMMWWSVGVVRRRGWLLGVSMNDRSIGDAAAHSVGESGVAVYDGSKGAAAALSVGNTGDSMHEGSYGAAAAHRVGVSGVVLVSVSFVWGWGGFCLSLRSAKRFLDFWRSISILVLGRGCGSCRGSCWGFGGS